MNPLLALLKHDKGEPDKGVADKSGADTLEKQEAPRKPASTHPHLDRVLPTAAMPGGEVEVHGTNLGPMANILPRATIGDLESPILLARPGRVTLRIPDGTISGDVVLHRSGESSNPLHLRVAVPMAENLHPVANPAVDTNGQVFATVSGARGQQVPVAIFCIQRDLQIRPHVRELMNATALAFGPDGSLYCSSRSEGTIYRISSNGTPTTYAEGLGIATGIAFDRHGNLFVGDRTGTIFKITPPPASSTGPSFSGISEEEKLDDEAPGTSPSIFVHATLEPSMAAYHLAFNAAGTLFVTGPTTSSSQSIHAIDPDGNTSVFFHGLGRAQGMAFDVDDNLYVAASLHGQRGIVRITPLGDASLILSGQNLVGLAFLEDGCAALSTRDALYHVDLGVQGRVLP
jgi:sugar lactone lactonase YvrE